MVEIDLVTLGGLPLKELLVMLAGGNAVLALLYDLFYAVTLAELFNTLPKHLSVFGGLFGGFV